MERLADELNEQWLGISLVKHPDEYLLSRMDVSRIFCILRQDYSSLCPNLQSLFRLAVNNSTIEMLVKPFPGWNRSIIPRVADVLVGIILRKPDIVSGIKVLVNDLELHSFDIVRKDEPVLACYDHIIPSLYTGLYTSVLFPPGVEVDLVYGNLASDAKMWMSERTLCHQIKSGKWVLYGDQRIELSDNIPTGAYVLPPVVPAWRQSLDKKREMTKLFEEELVRTAWHPDRLHHCLDCDDMEILINARETNLVE